MKRHELNWGEDEGVSSASLDYDQKHGDYNQLYLHRYATEETYDIRLYACEEGRFYYAHDLTSTQIDQILEKDNLQWLLDICGRRQPFRLNDYWPSD